MAGRYPEVAGFVTPYVPLNKFLSNRNKKTTSSRGRQNVVTPQALIVMQCTTDEYLEHRTKDTIYDKNGYPSNVYAPYVEDINCYSTRRGDLVFVYTDRMTHRGGRSTLNGGPLVHVTGTMNGLNKNRRLAFAGIVDNSGMGEGIDTLKDNAGALRVGGTATIINEGPKTIPLFSPFWADPESFMVRDERTGQLVPGVVNPGKPKMKAVPSTHPLDNSSVIGLINSATLDIELKLNELEKKEGSNPDPDAKTNILKILTDTGKKITDDILEIKGIAKKMPLFHFVKLKYCLEVFALVSKYDPKKLEEAHFLGFFQFWAGELNNMYEFMSKNRLIYAGSVNVDIRFVPKLKVEVNKPEDLQIKTGSILIQTVTALSTLQAQMSDFLNSLMVGISLNTAMTGESLDCILRTTPH